MWGETSAVLKMDGQEHYVRDGLLIIPSHAFSRLLTASHAFSRLVMPSRASFLFRQVRGGKPGYYPKLSRGDEMAFPHPVPLNLWDPFGFTSKMTPERKEKALLAEINNGRLAMIGIFGLISASKGLIVPGLDGLGIAPYSGEVMAPFTASDASLPYVEGMLKVVGTLGY